MFGIFKGLAMERKDEDIEENRVRSVGVMGRELSGIESWREMKEGCTRGLYQEVCV